jgi:protein-tyrosine phosphatase
MTTRTKPPAGANDQEQWARAKLYPINAYSLEQSDRDWFHSKANDLCPWDSADLARALKIIRQAAAAKRRAKPKRRRK